jgi:hypothetical protein
LRTISRTTSPDFVHWSDPLPMNPNLPGEHLYTSATHPYFRAPHIYVSLPTRFVPERSNSTDILFMTTRGDYSYDRTFLEAFIRPGLDSQRWGNRANYAAVNVIPTGLAEMSIYNVHSGYRYVLRTDGFASVNAPHRGGEMITKPFTFSGKELVINYSTSAAGCLHVELQTADGMPFEGYRLEDCPPIVGDSIERVVTWKGGQNLNRLASTAVRLRFVLKDADLFSLRFR